MECVTQGQRQTFKHERQINMASADWKKLFHKILDITGKDSSAQMQAQIKLCWLSSHNWKLQMFEMYISRHTWHIELK